MIKQMIKRTATMKITTTRRRRLIRASEATLRIRCPVCEREVEMLTGEQAAQVLEVDRGAMDRLIAEGQLHVVRTVSGSRRFCKASLFL